MKIYIAGPMRGIKDFNKENFYSAAIYLRSCGNEVINPHELDSKRGYVLESETGDIRDVEGWGDHSMTETIIADVEAVLSCDAIFLLKGYEGSKGAMAEAAIATWAGKDLLWEENHYYA